MVGRVVVLLNQDNKRRFRTYSRRLACSFTSGLRYRCVFMHVPKCGGTSLSEALYATVPIHRRIGIIDANSTRRATSLICADKDDEYLYYDDLPCGEEVYSLREKILLTHMAWDTDLIHGHVLFSAKAYQHFSDKYRFVTLLREPIERTLSNFLQSTRVGFIDQGFDQYLYSDVFRVQGLSMLRYFSGMHPIAPHEEALALELAKHNMTLFSIIGFLDDLPDFTNRFAAVFDRHPTIYRYNQANSSLPSLSPEQTDRVTKVLASELQLWQHARELYYRAEIRSLTAIS